MPALDVTQLTSQALQPVDPGKVTKILLPPEVAFSYRIGLGERSCPPGQPPPPRGCPTLHSVYMSVSPAASWVYEPFSPPSVHTPHTAPGDLSKMQVGSCVSPPPPAHSASEFPHCSQDNV